MIHSLDNDAFRPALPRSYGGKNLFGIRIMAGSAGCGGNSEARRQVLQTLIALSRNWHWDLADVPGKTSGSTQEPAADDSPSTDSAGYCQKEKITASASTKAILAPGCGLGIIQGYSGTAEVFAQA